MLKIIDKKNKLQETGQAMVEYAIVLPIFLMLIFMIIDYSNIIYQKLSFNIALRDSLLNISFTEDESKTLQGILNPYGPATNRYGNGYNYEIGEREKRGHDFYMNHKFLGGLTTEEYLKSEIKKRNPKIETDKITFSEFEKGRDSRIGIYSGFQHYHYQKSYGADDRNYQLNPEFSTIVIARLRANYKIESKGFFTKTLYPDGINHEKVIYKASKSIRWNPPIKNPRVSDPLDVR